MNEFQQQVRSSIKNIYDMHDLEAPVDSSNIICKKCKRPGVKPATVLYGTSLSPSFFHSQQEDFPTNVDLLIIAGSSLTVHPACNLVTKVSESCSRILINREMVGSELGLCTSRDEIVLSDCDDGFIQLATHLGWMGDLYHYADQMCENSKVKVIKAYQDLLE